MTASALKPQLRHAMLSKLNSKRSGKQNALQKGFTLVELMIVIVIVGILSAVALPNFLSQSDKAKATEAKTISSGYLKQIYAAFQEGGSTASGTAEGTGSIPCPQSTKYFSYSCSSTGTSDQITATGLAAAGNLKDKTITSSISLTGTTSGQITIGGVSG